MIDLATLAARRKLNKHGGCYIEIAKRCKAAGLCLLRPACSPLPAVIWFWIGKIDGKKGCDEKAGQT